MTYGHFLPDVEAKAPHSPVKSARKRCNIPGLQEYKGAAHVKRSDEEIVTIILEHLSGQRYEVIAQRHKVPMRSVQAWCEGTTRAKCHRIATARWRAKLGAK